MAVVRFFEQDRYDVAATAVVIQGFVHRIDALFLQRRVLDPATMSYTSFAIRWLQKPRILRKTGGIVALGGHQWIAKSAGVINEGLARMAAWVRLVIERLQAPNTCPFCDLIIHCSN